MIDVIACLEGVLLHRSVKLAVRGMTRLLTWAIAKMGISKQINESTSARDMCSGSVYMPTARYQRLRIETSSWTNPA